MHQIQACFLLSIIFSVSFPPCSLLFPENFLALFVNTYMHTDQYELANYSPSTFWVWRVTIP